MQNATGAIGQGAVRPGDIVIEKEPSCSAVAWNYCNYCPGYCCYRLPGATLYLDNLDINRIARQCREFPYGEPCPYLEREELLERIVPRIEHLFGPRTGE